MTHDTDDSYNDTDAYTDNDASDYPGGADNADDAQEVNDESNIQSPFPDGIGLSIENVQALISKHNETFVAKDDPILLTVTILNAFLEEDRKLQDKYLIALKNVYSEQVKDFLKQVQQSTNVVKESLETVSIEGLQKIHEKSTARINNLENNMKWACFIIGFSALSNVVVFILVAFFDFHK